MDWNEFTANAAKDILVGFIRGGYENSFAEEKYAKRAVRWAMALTEELKSKIEEEDDTDWE